MYQLLILAASDNHNRVSRIAEEWEKLGGKAQLVYCNELVFESTGENFTLLEPALNLTHVDAVFGTSSSIMSDYIYYVDQLVRAGAVTLSNDLSAQTTLQQSYMHRYAEVARAGIRTPKTIYFTARSLHSVVERIGYPFVLKKLRSSAKRGIKFMRSAADLELKWPKIANNDRVFVAKEYIKHRAEWRVTVVDGEVVSIFERRGTTEGLLAGFNSSAIRTPVDPASAENLCAVALKTCELLGYEMAGIDIVQDEQGELFVLDINKYFHFTSAEEITKVNVAEKIAQLLWKKVELKRDSVV